MSEIHRGSLRSGRPPLLACLLALAIAAYTSLSVSAGEVEENEATAAASIQSGVEEDRLAPLRFLVGFCWRASFPEGASDDTHCFTEMYGRSFIRDRHLVQGHDPDYRGETIYHVDSATNQISFRYWSSIGGVSDGVAVSVEGGVLFPAEHHVREDGSEVDMRSSIKQEGADRYVSVAEQLVDGHWRELWRMTFTKLGPAVEEESLPAKR